MPCYVFVPDDLERAKILATEIYGAKVVAVKGNYDDVNRLCSELAYERPWAFVNVSMNPARTLGPDVVTGTFTSIWVYFIACPAGAAAAMGLYDWLVLRPRTAAAETAVTEERPRRRSSGTS